MPAVRFALSRKTWLTPVILILLLAVVFPAIYLSATVNPQGHLRSMRIGLVVEKQTPSARAADAADQLAQAITTHINRTEFDLTTVTSAQLRARMSSDSIAAAIVIPADFNTSIATLLPGAGGKTVKVPVVQVRTNAADGGISSGLVNGNMTPLLVAVQHGFGQRLIAIAGATGTPLAATQAYLLARPFNTESSPYAALPENSGFGTSALYYALVLVLLGFIGASVINPLIDSALGFAPSEVGPLVARRPYVAFSRLRTLLIKFGLIAAVSPVAALIVQLIAGPIIGVTISNPFVMWAFSAASIAAIGISALTVFAMFGSGLGSLANTVFFIALSMNSSGGTVPIAATPPFFQWVSSFGPFHAIVDGVRALLYFGGSADAGLADGWLRVGIGGGTGIALGVAVAALYGRNRTFSRHPAPALIATSLSAPQM